MSVNSIYITYMLTCSSVKYLSLTTASMLSKSKITFWTFPRSLAAVNSRSVLHPATKWSELCRCTQPHCALVSRSKQTWRPRGLSPYTQYLSVYPPGCADKHCWWRNIDSGKSVQLCCDVTVVITISTAGHGLQRWSQADGEDGADVHHPEADGLWENQGWSSQKKKHNAFF